MGIQQIGSTKTRPAANGGKLKRGGRSGQHVYSRAIDHEICRRLSEGESLSSICRTPGFPCSSVVRKWVVEDRGGIGARYARAREAGLAAMADEIIAISDADYTGPDGHADNALVQQARLRVDARRWLLAKLLPKRYGDRVELVGDASAPLITRVELIAVAPRRIDTTPVTIEHDDAKSGDE